MSERTIRMPEIDLTRAKELSASFLHSYAFFALLALPILYYVCVVIYRLTLHPLAKYPGPIFGRTSQWYDVYHAFKGDKHINFYLLHKKYGTVVRFSPNCLSINDPAALRAIYSHGANVQKSEFYKMFRAAPGAISTLLATEKNHHARKRRIMGQAFSDQALRGLEQYVLQAVNTFMSRIEVGVQTAREEKRTWSQPLDMSRWCNWLVFDIMGELVFGRSFGTLGEKPENRDAIRLLGRAAQRNYVIGAMPWLGKSGIEKYLPPFRSLWNDRCQYLAFGKRQVMERTQDTSFGESGRSDIFSYLLHAKDPETGEGLPKGELWMEGNTLIVAGSDTTSTTLSATLYYLLHNTSCLERLTEEVRLTFSTEDEIRMGHKLNSCTYMRACIDEAMRMSPAVGGLLPRQVLAGGLRIPSLDLTLPPGVDVGVCTYAIQHHEDYVDEPFVYDPSRWLSNDSSLKGHNRQRSDSGVDVTSFDISSPISEKQNDAEREALHSVFVPFSMGNRACLGKPLVYMELGIALARLVYAYDMRLVPSRIEDKTVQKELRQGKRDRREYQLKDYFMSMNYGPVAEFKPRQAL